jgi:hypothetical protein
VTNDEELLAPGNTELAHPPEDARALLDEHGEVYRAQLVAARWLEQWLETVLASSTPGDMSDERKAGFEFGLREVIAHLRQGDFLPGGGIYEQEQNI